MAEAYERKTRGEEYNERTTSYAGLTDTGSTPWFPCDHNPPSEVHQNHNDTHITQGLPALTECFQTPDLLLSSRPSSLHHDNTLGQGTL